MINREITYERNINNSYMKIPAVIDASLDEKLIFRRSYQGFLPMEKCYVNGVGQYWYNISGWQALDAYCRMHPIHQDFFETIILRICSQLEILEWNLIDTNCLVIDPELIFVSHNGEQVSFILYPDTKGNFLDELQQLMEYLLTKLNHGDKEEVHNVYKIYNMTHTEGYSLSAIKQEILGMRTHVEMVEEETIIFEEKISITEKEAPVLEQKLQGLLEWIKEILPIKKEEKEEIPDVVYPEDEIEEVIEMTINPTICLASNNGVARGVLVYEGMKDYPDFELTQDTCMLGKNPSVKCYINRETISQFHAKFEYCDKTYYIEDMNSTNGTFINDQMLNYKERKALASGDVLRFADVKYRFL